MNLLDKIKQNPEEISFDEVIAYIDEHYEQKIELEDIAKIGGYNIAYTSQFFKRQMGISFVSLVLLLRTLIAVTTCPSPIISSVSVLKRTFIFSFFNTRSFII